MSFIDLRRQGAAKQDLRCAARPTIIRGTAIFAQAGTVAAPVLRHRTPHLDTFTLTALFVLLITSVTLARLWLARRQIAHVIGHRDHVPPAFASVISAEAHAKAADYTVAKVRHGMQDLLLGTGVLLVLTLGGG
ncbi:MAG: hypothetical protein EBS54_09430, partial [Betaproteobacteria bacterium]|nr:hypothetical protein [Betaproteobacteria bacterium]